jgi:hypothetical protein
MIPILELTQRKFHTQMYVAFAVGEFQDKVKAGKIIHSRVYFCLPIIITYSYTVVGMIYQKQIKEGIVQARPLTAKALFYAAGASTLIAGILHLAIVPMYFTQMTIDTTIFFIVSGLTQIFWVMPVIKSWGKPWYYVGIGGTAVLIIMYLVAVPGSGYPVSHLDIAIEFFQFAFIILCSIIVVKDRTTSRLYKRNI